jgi:lipoprotein-releasing system permease protein
MEKAMVSLLLFLIVLVAAFNIVSSLVMVVTDKKSDIAILRTLGASPATITRIFMVQGTIIGVIGTVSGAILGIVFASGISGFVGWLNNVMGLHLFDAYFINYLPSYLRWQDVLTIVSLSLVLSFLATIYPAMRAAKIQPAEALRYE